MSDEQFKTPVTPAHESTPPHGRETPHEGDSHPVMPAKPWSFGQRFAVTCIVFVLLMGMFIGLSNITSIDTDLGPLDQSISTVSNDTAVSFDSADTTLPATGTYEVETISDYIDLVQPSTGAVQHAHILVRMPKGVAESGTTASAQPAEGLSSAPSLPSKLPAAVYMHGAGYGTADNSFGDVATDLASAGFVTLTVDKPVWGTNDMTRDYPGSAHAYDQCVQYLRDLAYVDSSQVGIYATSESCWIAPYVIREDGNIAFQVLLSPLVFNPRNALGFFVTQDFAIVGANPGYQRIVERVFSADIMMFGLSNVDFNALLPQSYSIPTFVAYGSKDVMTPQVQGVTTILSMAHASGNWDVTIRNYPIGNHVLRLGDEAEEGTVLVDHYESDFVDWAVGTTRGLKQTTPRVAGATIRQSIAVPTELTAHRGATIYGVTIHALQIIALLVLAVCLVIAAIKHVANRRNGKGKALGYSRDFRRLLLVSFVCTFGSLLLFFAAMGQNVYRLVKLVWGSAPTAPGMIWWSWYAIQVVCAIIVFVWARVFTSGLEVLRLHGILRRPGTPRRPKAPEVHDETPFALTTLGRVTAVTCMVEILLILLVLAFWGLFLY